MKNKSRLPLPVHPALRTPHLPDPVTLHPPPPLPIPISHSDSQPLVGVRLGTRSLLRDLLAGKIDPSDLRKI
jgi:hypothetical protein